MEEKGRKGRKELNLSKMDQKDLGEDIYKTWFVGCWVFFLMINGFKLLMIKFAAL